MRVRKMMPGLFGAALLAAMPAHEAEADGAARVTIVTSDVDRFYALYDDPVLAAQPEMVAARYLATPTPGLAEFMVMRRITPEKLAAALQKKPQVFTDARGCAANLPEVRARLVAATDRLAQLYPAAKFPPITIAIGRATTAGTANAKGLYIGLEALCAAKFIEADDEAAGAERERLEIAEASDLEIVIEAELVGKLLRV